MANAREAAFRKAVEEVEHELGPMSDSEFRQFKQQWRGSNPSPSGGPVGGGDPRDLPVDRRQGYVKDAYTDAGKNVSGAARSIGDWLKSAQNKAIAAVAPGSEEGAENYEAGLHNLGSMLSGIGDRMAPGSSDDRDRKEEVLQRAVERMGNKLKELLTGESRFEELQPDAARKPVRLDPITLGEKGSSENPIQLEPVADNEPFDEVAEPAGVEVMPKEVAAVRFRKGGRENPVRLPAVDLPEDSPELRTGEVTIDVPARRKLAKR